MLFAQFFQFRDIGFVELGDMRDVLPGHRQMFGGFFADIVHGLTAYRSPFGKIRQWRDVIIPPLDGGGQWGCRARGIKHFAIGFHITHWKYVRRGPEPGTWAISMPNSRANKRTDGAAGISLRIGTWAVAFERSPLTVVSPGGLSSSTFGCLAGVCLGTRPLQGTCPRVGNAGFAWTAPSPILKSPVRL